MCLTHSEAKQTEISESGAEKGLLQSQARRTGDLCSKTPNSPIVLGEKFLIGKIWDEGHGACDFLMIGYWWGNRAVLQESCAQPEDTTLHLGGSLSCCRRTQKVCYIYLSWAGTQVLLGFISSIWILSSFGNNLAGLTLEFYNLDGTIYNPGNLSQSSGMSLWWQATRARQWVWNLAPVIYLSTATLSSLSC